MHQISCKDLVASRLVASRNNINNLINMLIFESNVKMQHWGKCIVNNLKSEKRVLLTNLSRERGLFWKMESGKGVRFSHEGTSMVYRFSYKWARRVSTSTRVVDFSIWEVFFSFLSFKLDNTVVIILQKI